MLCYSSSGGVDVDFGGFLVWVCKKMRVTGVKDLFLFSIFFSNSNFPTTRHNAPKPSKKWLFGKKLRITIEPPTSGRFFFSALTIVGGAPSESPAVGAVALEFSGCFGAPRARLSLGGKR